MITLFLTTFDNMVALIFLSYFMQKNLVNMTYVVLQNISDESAGEYKCQVSGEGPLFNTEILSKRLRVAGKYISYLID